MSPKPRLPVTVRYALIPGLAVVLLTAILLALAQWLLVDELARRTLLRSQHRAATVALELDETLRGSVREVRTLARSPLLRGGEAPRRARAELEFLQRQSPRYVWLGLVALDGTVVAATRGWLEGRSIASRPVFLNAQRETWLGDVHPASALAQLLQASGERPEELIDIGEPVRDADGRVVGVLAAHLGVSWVDRLRAAATGEVLGTPVPSISVHVLSGAAGANVLPGAPPPDGVPRRVDTPAPIRALDGTRYFAASRELAAGSDAPSLPWRVLVLQEREAALAPAYRVMQSMLALGVLATVAAGAFGYWLARRALQPWDPVFARVLAHLEAQPERLPMAEGVEALLHELEPRSIASPGGPEALLMRLARDAHDLRRVIDQLPIGLALIGPDWRAEYLNPAYTRLLGWTTEQVRGRLAAEFLFDAVERGEFVRMFEHFGSPPVEVATRFDALTPSGQRVAVQWHLVPLLGKDDRLEGAIAIVQDIRAERLAAARADALAGRLRALTDAAVEDLIATLDLRGRVLEWSRGAERLTNQPVAQALGRALWDVLGVAAVGTQWLTQAQRDGVCRIDADILTGDRQRRRFQGSLYALGLATGSARFGVILRDVTEQREVHRALETSEERLRLAIDAAQIGAWDIDLSGAQARVTLSDAYGQTFGMPPERLPQAPDEVYALIHDEERARVRAAFGATIRHDAPLQIEFRVNAGQGVRWHAVRGRAQRGPDGRAVRLIGVGMDITARRAAEAQLAEERGRLERILLTMAEGLVIMGADGRYLMVNAAAATIFGVAPADLVGRHFADVPWRRWPLDGWPDDRYPLQRLLDGETAVHDLRVGLERTDGTRRAISLNARPLVNAKGRVDGMVATFVDITKRHEAEMALADSEARLSAVIDSASDAIISTDVDGQVTLFNPAAERIFGHAAAAIVGHTLERLLPDAMRASHGRHLGAFARSGTTRRAMGAGRVQGRHADGRTLELEAAISQALVRDQPVLTAILRDVTDRVAQERALETTRGELVDLTRRLLEQEKQTTRRLAQALHDDLGQTLTALRLHWEAATTAPQPMADAIRARVGKLVVAANRQIRLVLGELRPPLLDDFGLASALDNELQQQKPVGGVPELVLSVAPRLQDQRWPTDVEYAAFMIAREAVVNALHHATARRIEVALEGDEGELQLSVHDDGVGVSAQDRAGRPGHLGLVGMRERALATSGTLAIDSPSGRGTIVTLTWSLSDDAPVPHR